MASAKSLGYFIRGPTLKPQQFEHWGLAKGSKFSIELSRTAASPLLDNAITPVLSPLRFDPVSKI